MKVLTFEGVIQELQRIKNRQVDEVREALDDTIEFLRGVASRVLIESPAGDEDDRYRIGEEVEFRWIGESEDSDRAFTPARVQLVDRSGGHIFDLTEYEVRRPGWKPKDGESVITARYPDSLHPVAVAGVYHSGMVFVNDERWLFNPEFTRPFYIPAIEKPWVSL